MHNLLKEKICAEQGKHMYHACKTTYPVTRFRKRKRKVLYPKTKIEGPSEERSQPCVQSTLEDERGV